MRTSTRGAVLGLTLALALTACGGDDDAASTGSGASEPAPADASSAPATGEGGTVGVILPDATTSPRWESADRPALQAAFQEAGLEVDIQNADGDTSKFGTLCDGFINGGVNVLMIVNLDSDSGGACLSKAESAGIATIDYDRLTLGGGAAYYVSFDNVEVGRLMGQGLQTCLQEKGKTQGVNVVQINGDPTDNNAALFKQGYVEALKPQIDSGAYSLVGDQTGEWDATVAGTAFEQLYTQNGGRIDGVVSANDTMAGGIIARLKANGVNGQIPVTGQDASVAGLQAILAGDQCMTVYKAVTKEAQAAAALAQALIAGEEPGSDIVNGEVEDSETGQMVPSALQTPVAIFRDSVKTVIDDGYQTAADVCTGEFAAACTELGIS